MPSVQIIFPPQFEPFQPYLAGPYLKALLATHGIDASSVDANIGFYDWFVARSISGKSATAGADDDAAYLRRNAAAAVAALKRRPGSLAEYRWATNVVDELLHTASPAPLRIGLTYLKVANRYSSSDLDAYLADPDNLFASYFEYDSDRILGRRDTSIYLFTLVVIDQLAATIAFAREIRRRRNDVKIIIGGPLVSRLHKRLAAVPWIANTFDAIAPGEAYRVLPVLLGLEGGSAGHISPDFSDCEWDRYWSCERVLPYLVAHGCKWGKCTFCSHHMTYDGYRSSSVPDVVIDIERLVNEHDIRCVSFCDEYLTPSQLRDIASGFLQRGLSVSWSTFARPEPAFRDQDFLDQLYGAGCRMLMFGLESGSQRIIKAMKKGTRVTNFRPILEGCKAANIAIRYDFMVGFPGETEEDVRETYEFISENRDVIDTPFSSYSVAAFELREGIPVQQAAEEYGIRARQLLRGDLDDQYEFENDRGLNEDDRRKWRDIFIRFAKVELSNELICPHNKTHQLVLKHLYDENAFDLPVFRIDAGSFSRLWARLARGVSIDLGSAEFTICNAANGGKIALSPALSGVVGLFHDKVCLKDAFDAQNTWGKQMFSQFITFLYRNEYLEVGKLPAPPRPRSAAIPEAAHV